MSEIQPDQQLSKKERYEAKLRQKMEKKTQSVKSENTKKITRNIIVGVLISGVVGLLLWTAGQGDSVAESDIISRNGLHYHPKLDIYIKGQLQTIPTGIGLGAAHQPMHTHDTDNIIHLEMPGLVTLENTRLEKFFKIWGKQFNSNCIFDNCNGSNGKVTMTVNGQPTNDFEKYPMKDEDKIEIRYE